MYLTRNHIPSIKSIIILNEAKAIHELDLSDVASPILEMVLDVFLGDCRPGSGSQQNSSMARRWKGLSIDGSSSTRTQ